MKKLWLIVCLALCLGALPAQASETAFIRDGAAVLAPETQSDARKLSGLVADEIGIRIAVDIRHFLGGAEAQAYAKRLLDELPEPESSLLLLVVVGEESYALAAGQRAAALLGKETRDTLLSKAFRGAYLERQYDRAVGDFLLSLAKELGKARGSSLDLTGLFGYVPASSAATAQQTGGIDLLDVLLGEPVTQNGAEAAARREKAERQDKGLGLGSIILIGLVLSSVFGGKKRREGRGGCGCGPLGWIFGVFGVSKLFGWRR